MRSRERSANGSNMKSIGVCENYGKRKKLDEKGQSTTTAEFNQVTSTTALRVTLPQNNVCFPSSKGDGLKWIPFDDFQQWYKMEPPKNWREANKTCEDGNGVLLYAKTQSSDATKNFLEAQEHVFGYMSEIWIGIRVNEAGNYVDVHGNPIVNYVYVVGASYPGDCLSFPLDASGLQSQSCDNLFSFICELNEIGQ